MKITILGTRGEIDSYSKAHKNHSGILIDNMLFDVGEEDYLKYNPKVIFVTHFHPDYAYFVKDKKDIPDVTIYAPENYDGVNVIKPLESVKVGRYRVTSIPTIHSKKVKSTAYLIENSKKVLYTGDMIWIRKSYHDRIKNLDLAIVDASFIRKGGMIRRDKDTGEIYGHNGVPDLVRLFKRLGCKRIILTHFGEWIFDDHSEEKVKDLEDEYNIPIEIGVDNMTVELSVSKEDVEAITPKVFPSPPKYGLYLVSPHGRLIWEGKKTSIIKTKKFTEHIGENVYLFSDGLCYGIIVLKEPREITKEEFDNIRDQHMITEEEFKEWNWSGKKLYEYKFRLVEKYDPPIPVRLPKGVQVWVSVDKVKFLKPEEMTLHELVYYHALSHSLGTLFSPFCELHLMIANELLDRGYVHLDRSPCDRVVHLIRGWIDEYDPSKPNDRQLGDDFRIVLAWYSSIKRGKKLYKRVGEEKKEITLDDCKQLALKIFKEMIKRGFTFNRPETYKEHARELFEWLIKQVGEDKVPFRDKLSFRLPEGMTVEDIDVEYVVSLDTKTLIELYKWLHKQYEKIGRVTEPLHNANIFVGIELLKRGIYDDVKIDDKLTEETDLEIVEYPTREGLEDKDVTIDELYDMLPETLVIDGQPYGAYITGRIANTGVSPVGHDIDILFRQYPDVRVIRAIKSIDNKLLSSKLHPFFDPNGPNIGYSYPIYKYGFFKVPKDEFIKGYGPYRLSVEVKPFMKFKPLKSKSGWEKYEFFTYDTMYREWASKYLQRGIVVQKKADGRRFIIHKDGDKVAIITEDKQRDRSKELPNVVKDLLKFKHDSFIMDCECVAYDLHGKEVKKAMDKDRLGEEIPREDTAWLTIGDIKPEQEKSVVFICHDLLYLDGKDLHNEGYLERFNLLKKVIPKNSEYFIPMPTMVARNPRELKEAVYKMRTYKGSEGCMLKVMDSKYPIKQKNNRTPEWCKLKNLKSIDVIVHKIVPKRKKDTGEVIKGQYMYDCAIAIPPSELKHWDKSDLVEVNGKIYAHIGRTFATGKKANVGDIIEVLVGRIREYVKDGTHYITWMFPKVRDVRKDKNTPDTLDTARKLAKVGSGFTEVKERLYMDDIYTFDLELCPYWKNSEICPMKHIFGKPRYELSVLRIEYLKYPMSCPLAYIFKCRYLKSYYYGYRTFHRKY